MLARFYAFTLLLGVAFLARVAFFAIHNAPLEFPDSVAYWQIASNVCAGVGLTQDAHTQVFRPPLYPLFVAAIRMVFGPSLWAVGVAQACLGALTVLAVFYLGRLMFDDQTGWLSAVIVALYPFFIFYSALVLSETLFILLLTWAMASLIWMRQALTNGTSLRILVSAFLTGVLFGLGILTRASLAAFPFFAGLLLVMSVSRHERWRAVVASAIMLLAVFVVLLPWAVRNRRLTGHFVFTALQSGRALYEANSPEADGGPAAHRIDWEKVAGQESLSEFERDRLLRQKALAYIRQHPGRFLQLAWVKFFRFWSLIPNYEKYRTPLYNMVSLFSFGTVLTLALVGVILLRRRWSDVLVLASPLLYYSVLHTVFVGSTRYRTPVEPFLILLAAYVIRAGLFRAAPSWSRVKKISGS